MEQKKFEEVTLYNFVSLRSPQNREKKDKEIQIDFIFCDLIDTEIKDINLINNEINSINNARDYIDYEDLIEHHEIRQVVELGKKINEYRYKEINFSNIYNKLLHINFDSGCVKEIKQIAWKALIKVTKYGGELKFKEALINILKIFHLKKLLTPEFQNDIILFKRLIDAQVVIPKELFPKEDTFFFGEKIREYQIQPNIISRVKNNNNISQLTYQISQLDDADKTKGEKENKLAFLLGKKASFDKEIAIQNLFRTPLVCSILADNKSGIIILNLDNLYFNSAKVIEKASLLLYKDQNKETILLAIDNGLFDDSVGISFNLNEDYCRIIIDEAINQIIINGIIETKNTVYRFEVKTTRIKENVLGSPTTEYYGETTIIIDEGDDSFGTAFPPSGYGVKQLGIAEYRKVVSTISRYVPAEVAKIENVMASEYREMATTKEISKEVTDFESTDNSSEKETENISIDRFQMQTEIANIFRTQNTNKFDTKASYGADSTKLEISYGTATVNSKEESNKQAFTNAKEVTNKAVEKIFSRVRKERTVTVTEKYTEANKHGYDNRGNKEHVSGVYRHINAVYKNQILNYGRRLMYEFAIPEPALFHKLAILEDDSLAEIIKKIPKHPCLDKLPESENEIDKSNYEYLAKLFDVELNKIPDEISTIKEENNNLLISDHGKYQELIFPDSNTKFRNIHFNQLYRPKELKIQIFKRFESEAFTESIYDNEGSLFLKIGNKYSLQISRIKDTFYLPLTSIPLDFIDKESNIFDWFLVGTLFRRIVLKAEITFERNEAYYANWQKENYLILKKKHEEENNKYLNEIKRVLEENPIVDKFQEIDKEYIQRISLRKQCIEYLISDDSRNLYRKMGQDMFENREFLQTLKIRMDSKLNEYTAFARFLEQAFDWEAMEYAYYPFYWAKKEQWKLMYNLYDEDSQFKKFLQAGIARVLVSIRPGFEKAIMQYMLTGKIWEGGEVPTYESSLFLSIAAEMSENPEYKVDKTWETILPTNLIALQSSGVAIDQKGLPNLENDYNLGDITNNPAKFPRRKRFLGLF